MRKLVLLAFLIFTTIISAQSDKEIAGIYLVKSEEKLAEKELDQSLTYFNKAKALLGDDTTAKVEELGTMIYYNLKEYTKAKEYAKRYFSLASDKKSERYKEVLYLYVELGEKIEAQNKIDELKKAEELLALKKKNRLDSLTKIWEGKADAMSIDAEKIYDFDKNGVAVFKTSKGNFGAINEGGMELIAPDEYSSFIHFDGYVVLMEGIKNQPTKITVLNTTSKEISTLPAVSKFNPLSTNYGKVMLPREGGILVTYPNNSAKIAVYDLNSNTIKSTSNLKTRFEYWKKLKVIKKYNKENQIKIDKEYLNYGGDLGGFSAFYTETGNLTRYISVGGVSISPVKYKYIGTLSNGFLEATNIEGNTVWLDEKGNEIELLVDKNGTYEGNTKVKQVGSKYQFINVNGEIIKGGESLESLKNFLKNFE